MSSLIYTSWEDKSFYVYEIEVVILVGVLLLLGIVSTSPFFVSVFLYEIDNSPFKVFKKSYWNFDANGNESLNCFW